MKSQRQISSDRISALPEDIIAKILSHMPIRDALRTSILSKKWRYCWTRMPKLVFDDELVEVSSDTEEISEYKLVSAIFHVLLLHRAPILELHIRIVDVEIDNEIDLIILHLSRSNKIKKFIFEGTDSYVLPCSFYKLRGLEHLDLENCSFELPLINKGFSMLKTLRFEDVEISAKMLKGFLANCPLLEEFTWIRDDPIELTECVFVELFRGGMPHTLPTLLVHLRILVLTVCFGELSSVLCVINSSPNLEKIKMKMVYYGGQTSTTLLDPHDYSGLNLDHLKELEITRFHNYASEMEFLKLIMAKSPVLKKARIVLGTSVSVDKEVKMLRDFIHLPFPRASPAAKFIIERLEK